MRSPVAMRIEQQTPQPPPDAVAPASNQQEDERAPSSATQFSLDKTESDDEASDGQRSQPQPPDFAGFEPHAEAQSRGKRAWHSRSQHQLLQRTRRRARRSSSGENQSQQSTGDNSTVSEVESAEGEGQTTAGNFAGEIESEAAEIRTLIARTARLWTAVDRAEHSEEVSMRQQSQAMETVSAQIRNELLPTQYTRVEVDDDEDSTLSSDDQDSEDEVDDENTETESLNGTEVRSNQDVAYPARDEAFVSSVQHNNAARVSSAQAHAAEQLPFRVDGENEESHIDDDSESEDFDEMDSEGTPIERGLELEQGEVMDASNRVINAAKARAIKNAMLGNLIKLSFRESITHAALEAGVLEIDHYDSDCELAYVDIFMSLVKMVCDAHVDVINGIDDAAESWMSPVDPTHEIWEAGTVSQDSHNLELRSFLPFKWPVFDMAQFEFGNARPGTCFNSVCVLTNLPKVSMDRTEELMEMLSCNLFCMIGDPIQVVIPSASSTGRTKGHAFLEFDDPEMAKSCALAVDGLTWGRGPFGRIRGNLFRQYQVKSPADERRRSHDAVLSSPFAANGSTFEALNSERAEMFRSNMGRNLSSVNQQQRLSCDSDEDSSDADEWVGNCPHEYVQFNPTPLQDLSSDSIGVSEQHDLDRDDNVMMRLGWDDAGMEAEYATHFSSDDENEDGDDNSFDSDSVLELQTVDEEKFMDQSVLNELLRRNDGMRNTNPATQIPVSPGEVQAESLTVAPPIARDTCQISDQPWDAPSNCDEDVERPWRRYCEDLIIRNREMQEQVALARRRIVQLSHNNQKLHLLADRVERDRDGLLFENDLLQSQLHGYEDHEHHHDSLMKELIMLRKRLKRKEQTFDVRSPGPSQQMHGHLDAGALTSNFNSLDDIRVALNQLSPRTLASYKMDELKVWEHLLEATLGRVRSAKEEKALEMQKKLDRQAEEQNELMLCVICLSNEKRILCLPCRHLCLCQTCSTREEVDKCPICRLEIEEMLAIYS